MILASNYTGAYNPGTASRTLTQAVIATHFTTGDNENGYLLTKVTHGISLETAGEATVGAEVRNDNAGEPSADSEYLFPA